MVGQDTHDGAQHHTGVIRWWDTGSAAMHHVFGLIQEALHIEAHNRCRYHTKIRQHRITSTNTWPAEENAPEAMFLRHLLHLRARISNSDEVLTYRSFTHRLLDALEEILLKDVWLQRTTRLARDNAHRLGQIHLTLKRFLLGRVGRVQHV